MSSLGGYDANPKAPDIPARMLTKAVYLPLVGVLLAWSLVGGVLHGGGLDQSSYGYRFLTSTWALFIGGFLIAGIPFMLAPPYVKLTHDAREWLTWLCLFCSAMVGLRCVESYGFDLLHKERHAYVQFLSEKIFDCEAAIVEHPTVKYVYIMSGTCPYDLETILWENIYEWSLMMLLPLSFVLPTSRRSIALLFNLIFLASGALFLHIIPSVYYLRYVPGVASSAMLNLPFALYGIYTLYASDLVNGNHIMLGTIVAGPLGLAVIKYLPVVLFREAFIGKELQHNLIVCLSCGLPLMSIFLTPTPTAVGCANRGGTDLKDGKKRI
ncbi:hypothetical protein SARC_02716 [Sphaeroforma arctica JP610]|uniref:Uncharacterized protein n=1 Tax=Sphaeroforma arctica JP610 TaxID=667725 RepID=A0A0L0G863_9EUKA|nr:hypothetical protein SARC_02716 [Sphaeroforma arctica JP610]KNC85089.1 hypothetical protein SARC_02716 [Sphaeroforma arctica JP610]|eukprot:XP_014158991.1 hypothetical protein SARC_02716 [Sphaeroforma arctica JP610]